MTCIFTIGHSNHEMAVFLGILRKYGIRCLADVRSDPYSRYAPQFNRGPLEHTTQDAGIAYRYSGDCLGGRPKDPSLRTSEGKPDYDRLAASEPFQTELRELTTIADTMPLVLMCSEADPLQCHREVILAPVLRNWGVEVRHILPDSTLMKNTQLNLI